MASDVYIFGYQSMLAAGSLAMSVGAPAGSGAYVPARLRGFVRAWNAVRDFAGNPRKRYVQVGDWRPAGRVAFANLAPDPAGAVNGICRRVAADRLAELDFREQGYARVPVEGALDPYPGHALARGLPCYAYLDLQPDPAAAPVSRAYYDMGRRGAQAIDAQVPGFAADFAASTRVPPSLADDLAFVFISADGRHLWLLDEADSSLVLLLVFGRPQFAPTGGSPAEADRPITPGLEGLDLRRRGARPVASPRVPAALAATLLGADAAGLAGSPYWLCRLAATQAADLSAPFLTTLAADPDPWVRRALRIRMESHA